MRAAGPLLAILGLSGCGDSGMVPAPPPPAPPPIAAPQVTGQLPDLELTAGGPAAVVDLSQAVSGEVTEWSATSSDTSVAAVSVADDGRAEVRPAGPGTAQIAVTARNAGGVAETTFTVRVLPQARTAPFVTGTLTAPTLGAGAGSFSLDLAGAFSPPGFTLAARSLDPGVVSASVSGTTLVLVPLSAGSTTIEITARNAVGSAVRSLAVTVVAPPTATGTLAPLALVAGTTPTVVDLSTAFSPATGLSFQATSGDPEVAAAAVSGNELTVTPVAPGTTEITVIAQNAAGSISRSVAVVVTAEDQASAPRPVGTLAPLTLGAGSGPVLVDVGAAFTPRGFRLEARSLNPRVATVSVHGDTALRVTPVGAGRTTIEITALNAFGSGTRNLQVEVVGPPSVSVAIQPVSLTIGAPPTVVDLRGAFAPPGFGVEARSLDESVVTASVGPGPSLTLTPVAAGATFVEITARNAGGSTTQTVRVTVSAAGPRAVGTLAPVALSVGGTAVRVDVADAFTPAGVPLEVRSRDSRVAAATLSGTVVTLTPVAAGNTVVEVTARNAGGSATLSIAVTVTAPPAPQLRGSPGQVSFTVGDGPRNVGVTFTPTGVAVEARSLDTGVVTVAVNGSDVTLTPVGAGRTSVVVTARNVSGSATHALTVTVAGEAPQAVGTPGPFSLSLGGSALEIDLTGLFTPTAVHYTYRSGNPGIVRAELSGTVLTLTPAAAGTTTVTAGARNALGSATHTISVTVTGADALRAVGTLAPVSLTVGGEPATVDVADAFTPAGFTVTASSGRETVATVAVDGTVVTITPVGEGTSTVYVTASSASGTAQQRMSVTVAADTSATVDLADVTLQVGGDALEVDVARAFAFTNFTVEANSREPGIATVTVNGTVLTLTPVSAGRTLINVTARPQSGGSSTKPFYVTVLPMAPQAVGALDPVTLRDEGPAVEVDVADAFTPADVRITARYTGNVANIAVSVTGTVVTVTPRSSGNNVVEVTARNAAGSATQTFAVTVLPVPPAAVGAVDAVALVVGGAPVERNLFYAFEGVQRRLEASSNDTGVVTATMQDDRWVTLTPVGAGNTSVVLTARNAGGSASHTVSVSVTTAVPQKIGTLNPDTIAFSGNNYFVVRIANVFSPATVKVAARSNDTGVVTAEVTTDGPDREPIVRVTPVGLGTTTVVITGSTSEGSVSYTWEVTVVAPN